MLYVVFQVLRDASQELVYETCAQDLVAQLMRGFNGTLLAYGETGAGIGYIVSVAMLSSWKQLLN